MPTRAALLLSTFLLGGCRSPPPPAPASAIAPAPHTTTLPPPATPSAAAAPTTKVEMHNVIVHEDTLLRLRIRWLRGEILPTRSGVVPSFDDKQSMIFQIEAGVISVSTADITTLLNRRVLAYPGSPLTNVTLSTQGAQIKLKGTLHKGVPLPIEMLADLGTTTDGHIRLHAVKLSALHVPVKGLLKGFGIHVSDLIDPKGAKGITLQGDDVILNMEKMMPAPEKRGFLTAVHVRGNDLVEIYGNPRAEVVKARQWKNFIACRGGTLRFGKLTMNDADMIMIDTGPDSWFDFFLDHYQEQLRAGYIKTTPTRALEIFMPDFNTIHAHSNVKENQ